MGRPRRKALLVTGTDTGVGKTWVAGGLAGVFRKRGHRVGNLKPAESGCPVAGGEVRPEDALFVRRLAGCEAPPALVCPYRFEEPLAPAVAAKRQGVEIDPEVILRAFEEIRAAHDVTLVEGAGGLLAPVAENLSSADLAARLGLPLLVVGRLGLGTLNHTLLTLEAAERRGLRVLGVVLNAVTPPGSVAEETNPEVLASLTDVPLLGVLPHLPVRPGDFPEPDILVAAAERALDAGALAAALGLSAP